SSNSYDNSDLRENRITDPITFLDQQTHTRSESFFGSGDLTAELKTSSKGTLWTELRAYRSDFDSDGTIAYTLLDFGQAPIERYDRLNLSDGGYLNAGGSVGYRHAF